MPASARRRRALWTADPAGRVLRGQGLAKRKCGTCQFFQSGSFADSGWCLHPQRRQSSDVRIMVRRNEFACRNGWGGDLWEAGSGDGGGAISVEPVAVRPADPATRVEIAAVARVDAGRVESPRAAGDDRGRLDAEPTSSATPVAGEDVVVGHTPMRPAPTAELPVTPLPPVVEPDARSTILAQDTRAAIFKARERARANVGVRARAAELALPATDAPAPRAGSDAGAAGDALDIPSAPPRLLATRDEAPAGRQARPATAGAVTPEPPAPVPVTELPADAERLAEPTLVAQFDTVPSRRSDFDLPHAGPSAHGLGRTTGEGRQRPRIGVASLPEQRAGAPEVQSDRDGAMTPAQDPGERRRALGDPLVPTPSSAIAADEVDGQEPQGAEPAPRRSEMVRANVPAGDRRQDGTGPIQLPSLSDLFRAPSRDTAGPERAEDGSERDDHRAAQRSEVRWPADPTDGESSGAVRRLRRPASRESTPAEPPRGAADLTEGTGARDGFAAGDHAWTDSGRSALPHRERYPAFAERGEAAWQRAVGSAVETETSEPDDKAAPTAVEVDPNDGRQLVTAAPAPVDHLVFTVDDAQLGLPVQLAPELPRMCVTCRDFRPAEAGGRGWCTNRFAFSHRRMVDADELPCAGSLGTWWLPRDDAWLATADVQSHSQPTPMADAMIAQQHLEQPAVAVGGGARRSRQRS